MIVIGLDFGNYNSFPCFISDFDQETRMGGIAHDLLPSGQSDGIPSVYYYSQSVGELCGEEAVRSRAKPAKNRIRYLKRHLGESLTLDDRKINYDAAIVSVIQHCVRRANAQLLAGWQVSTYQIALSYPATYTVAQRKRLIELAEQATLEDGTHVKVVGTIAEPAAAALDYLAGFAQTRKETTVLTYDLGGGTFDLALVAAYPGGRKNPSGQTYYYDILNARGLADVGGVEFDEILYQQMLAKLDVPLSTKQKTTLRQMAETLKVDLTTDDYAEAELFYDDDYLPIQVTKAEFEAASKALLTRTITATQELLRDHPKQQPELILLTGGASQMPMVKRALEEALPQYRDKIVYFRPSRAIAYGAARFGAPEEDAEVGLENTVPQVQQRTLYDIGVRFYDSIEDEMGHISTYIPAGTPIPYTGKFRGSRTLNEWQRYADFHVYESVVAHPDTKRVDTDYTKIMTVTLDHEKEVPKGTRDETRLDIDSLGVLTIQARVMLDRKIAPVKSTVKLENLSGK